MATANSTIAESGGQFETDIQALGLMVKGLYECIGSGLEVSDADALTQAYSRLHTSYRKYTYDVAKVVEEANEV